MKDLLNRDFNNSDYLTNDDIAQGLGNSINKAISQKSITDILGGG